MRSTWNLSRKFLEKIGLMDPLIFLVTGFLRMHSKHVVQKCLTCCWVTFQNLFAVSPRPLLTHVALEMMPLIDSIKYFLSRKDDAAWLEQLSILIFLKPSQHCTWCRVTWSPDLINSILMNVLVPSRVGATKCSSALLPGPSCMVRISVPTCQFSTTYLI